jgi:hypothetical protein
MKMNIDGLERVFSTELPSGFDLTPGFKPKITITIAPSKGKPKKK